MRFWLLILLAAAAPSQILYQVSARIRPGVTRRKFQFSHPQLFLAEIHLRRGRKHEAASVLEDFLQHHPDYPREDIMRRNIVELRQ